MPSKVRCFLITPIDEAAVYLRRYASKPCPLVVPRYPGAFPSPVGIHDVERTIGFEPFTDPELEGDRTGHTVPLDSPLWPSSCPCGYVFTAEDEKQEHRTRLYVRADTGERMTVNDAPAGALYDARRLHDFDGDRYTRHEHGVSLILKTPAGEWLIDGPATNGDGWTRRGTPPDLVVTPSIAIGSRMHGWLGGFSGAGNEPGWLCIDSP